MSAEQEPQVTDHQRIQPEGSLIQERDNLQQELSLATRRNYEAQREQSLIETRGAYDYASAVALPISSLVAAVSVARSGHKEKKARRKLNNHVGKIAGLQEDALNDARHKGVEVT